MGSIPEITETLSLWQAEVSSNEAKANRQKGKVLGFSWLIDNVDFVHNIEQVDSLVMFFMQNLIKDRALSA